MNKKKFLDPLVLKKIEKLYLISRLLVDGTTSGIHESVFSGINVEFSHHRQYQKGDDIKNIDWKIFAKTDKYYVKQSDEDTNLKVYIALDTSNSMNYSFTDNKGNKRVKKIEYATFLGATLAYFLTKQKDSIGFLNFSEDIENFVPAKSSTTHLNNIFNIMENLKIKNDTNIYSSIYKLATKIKRRSLIIIISDLLDDQEKVIKACKLLKHKKNDVVIFNILDDSELDFNFSGVTVFKDLEDRSEFKVNADVLRKSYQKEFDAFLENYKMNFRKEHIDYIIAKTSDPLDATIAKFLRNRGGKRVD